MLDREAAPAFALVVTVDGVRVPDVIEVTGLSAHGEVVELKQQTADGKYVVRQLPGRAKTGEFTVTRGLTAGAAPFDWVKAVTGDDIASARPSVSVSLVDDGGEAVRSYEFRSCRIASVKAKWPRKDSDRPPVEKITLDPDSDPDSD